MRPIAYILAPVTLWLASCASTGSPGPRLSPRAGSWRAELDLRTSSDQRAVILVRIELQANSMARKVEARQHLGDTRRGRLLRR